MVGCVCVACVLEDVLMYYVIMFCGACAPWGTAATLHVLRGVPLRQTGRSEARMRITLQAAHGRTIEVTMLVARAVARVPQITVN